MFKKIFNISIFGILTLTFLPMMVDASVFENGNKKYELKEVTTKCSLNTDAEFYGLFNNTKKYVFVDSNQDTTNKEEYYIMDYKGNCSKMSVQQILDYRNQLYYYYQVDNYNFNKYKFTLPEIGYVPAEGTTYSEERSYYKKNEDDSMSVVSSPNAEELDNYYILESLSYPTEAVIDENITYYTLAGGEKLNKVLNPVVEDMYLYYYYDVNAEPMGPQFVETLETITADNLIEIFNSPSVPYINYFNGKNKNFILVYGHDRNVSLYDTDGNLINIDIDYDLEVDSIIYLDSMYFLSFIEYSPVNHDYKYLYKIYNSDGEELYSDNDLAIGYNLFTLEDGLFSFALYNDTVYSPYLLREYKLLTQDNLTYDNNDLSFRFSGEYEDVKSVKINDQVLNSNDYTLTKGSTIVTLKNKYLKTLAKGDYVLKVAYKNDIELTSSFKIKNDPIENPETSDGIINYIIFGIISIIGLFGILLYFKRKNNCFGNN